jgi:hypothetical protein
MPNVIALQPQTTTAISRSPGAITRRPQVRHGLDPVAGVLHVGSESVALDDVATYGAAGFSEKDLSTAFATIALFSGISAVFIFLVVEIGWRMKFLLEGILFGSIAFCAVAELFSARRNTLYTFTLTSDGGAVHTFVTADRVEAEAVKAALDAAGAQLV